MSCLPQSVAFCDNHKCLRYIVMAIEKMIGMGIAASLKERIYSLCRFGET